MFEEEIHHQLKPLLKELEASTPYCEETLDSLHIHSGAYVFYEGNDPMYVGIVGPHSKQDILTRIRQHRTGTTKTAPLPSRMTIADLGLGPMTLKKLGQDHNAEFKEKQRIVRNMKVRAIEIRCCVTLAAFEIYAAVTLETPYNDFCIH